MKPLEELNVCIVDAGTFIPLADMMGKSVAKCGYYSPWEQEYVGLERCCIGSGMKHFDRVDDFMQPDYFNSVDLWMFPDIGYGGLQRYLRSIGKAVWGSMGASDLELFRTRFLNVLKEFDLPMSNSVVCRGLTELVEHIKGVENKWVKINRYRDNMETWHHQDWIHSQREIERLAKVFGPLKECVVFVVQDPIESEDESPVIEVGFDGWFITGPDGEPRFPPMSYQGYEAKNELYLGSRLDYGDLPDQVREVNEKIGPVLSRYGYRNFWATEIRIKDGIGYFIDPTARMAGQTMEHLLNTCTNLPEIIWRGANGEVVKPEFVSQFAAEATMHYKNADGESWKTFCVPDDALDKFKLYRCCFCDGAFQFPPHHCDELGVVIGNGDTIEDAIDDMNENFEAVKDEPVSINTAGFADLIEQIEQAESKGVEFADGTPVPEPESVT